MIETLRRRIRAAIPDAPEHQIENAAHAALAAHHDHLKTLETPTPQMIEVGMTFRLIERSTGTQDTAGLFAAMMAAAQDQTDG